MRWPARPADLIHEMFSNHRQLSILENGKAFQKQKPKNECRICKKVFSSKGNLVQHMDTHVDLNGDDEAGRSAAFECGICGKRFLQKRYLMNHQTRCPPKKTKLAKKTHHCGLCGKIFEKLAHLRRHQAHHLKQSSFICTICDRSFVQQHHLQRHFQSQTHQQKAQCGMKRKLNPIGVASNSRRHKCPFCIKAFSTGWEMQRHWRTVHPYAIRRTVPGDGHQRPQTVKTTFLLKCTRCGIRFDDDLAYQNHLEWHQGIRPHKCDYCTFAFRRRLELANHQAAKHGIGWMFECIQCGEKFAQRTGIDRHLKNVHPSRHESTHLQRYQDDPLRLHLNVGGAPLQCKYCGMETYGVDEYRDHLTSWHVRKIFVESPKHTSPAARSPVAHNSPPVAASARERDQIASAIELVVSIDPSSKPVHVLRLGPTLPDWLLKLQPSYAMLDVALDEGQPLMAGESVVLQLPVSAPVSLASLPSRVFRVTYSV